MKHTVFALKIRAGKKTKEFGQVFLLLFGLSLLISLVFAVKAAVCKYDHPERTFKQCMTK